MYQSFWPEAMANSQVRMSSPVIVTIAPEYSSIRAAMRYTPREHRSRAEERSEKVSLFASKQLMKIGQQKGMTGCDVKHLDGPDEQIDRQKE